MNSKLFLASITTAAVATVLASCTGSTEVVNTSDAYVGQISDQKVTVVLAHHESNTSDRQNTRIYPKREKAQDVDSSTASEAQLGATAASTAATSAEVKSRPMVAEYSPAVIPRQSLHSSSEAATVQKPDVKNTEKYHDIDDNRVVVAANEPTSTFSIDVDSGAYSNMRRLLSSGALPPAGAIRIEELVNYFSYTYDTPVSTEVPFSVTTELAPTPWNSKTHLLHVGLKGFEIDAAERPDANLVFLIDVSGSMGSANKLGLLKPAMKMLSDNMTATDTISIVVYAGASGVVLEPTAGNDSAAISRAINSLQAGGSTNGRAGIELAYEMAAKGFKKGGINRVILATDGDFNVGLSDVEALKSLIEVKRDSGIALTTLGFGSGNYNDHLMEQLADVGNGAYAYIDNLNEARKVLADEVTSTLLTIAKDVKIQIEFNPSVVSEYRLIGYENRHLNNEDFANDKIDAGEIGAGHTVTALYEIALVGDGGERNSTKRYGKTDIPDKHSNEIAELRLRYKAPDSDTSKLVSSLVMLDDRLDSGSTTDNFRFSAAVAGLGQLLRASSYMNEYKLSDVLTLAAGATGNDEFGYRQEFTNLVRLAETLSELRKAEVHVKLDENRG